MKCSKNINKVLRQLKKHKAELLVVLLLFVAKFLGFVKNIFMAKYYGASAISDAYQMATSIPMIVLGLILHSYQAFTKGYFISEKENRTKQYVSTFINFILILLFAISILLSIFPKEISSVFAPGFNEEQMSYTLEFLKPIILGTIFLGVSNILSEYLRCRNSFVVAHFAYLIINIIEILTIFVAFFVDYRWLSYGYLLANFSYFIILIVICKRKRIRYSLTVFEKKELKIFIQILIPIFISSVITDVNSMVDKMFASSFDTGIVSTLSYSTNIKSVLLIIAAGYLTVLFPKISKKFVEKEYVDFNKKIKEGLVIILSIYLPLTLFTIFFSQNIVEIVYYRGAFDADALNKTVSCLIMYTVGITGICIRDLYIKALYCMEKGRSIVVISIISVVLNIVLNYVLSNNIGYIGLPLATSLSVWIMLPFLITIYLKNIKYYLKNSLEVNDCKKSHL